MGQVSSMEMSNFRKHLQYFFRILYRRFSISEFIKKDGAAYNSAYKFFIVLSTHSSFLQTGKSTMPGRGRLMLSADRDEIQP